MFERILSSFRKPRPAPAPELDQKLRIDGREAGLFERALQLYIFVHHVPHSKLEPALAEQLGYVGNAVYSLLLNWLRDGKPSLEYMDFLNEKVQELRAMPKEVLGLLQIRPDEVEEIELQDVVKLRFQDDETGRPLYISWHRKEQMCRFNKPE